MNPKQHLRHSAADAFRQFQRNQFWADAILGRQSSKAEEIPEAVTTDADITYWLLLVTVRDWSQETDWRRRFIIDEQITGALQGHLLCGQDGNGWTHLEDGRYFVVLDRRTFSSNSLLLRACEGLTATSLYRTSCALCCYFAAPVPLEALPATADLLMEADRNNVNGRAVVFVDQAALRPTVALRPDFRQWRYYFTEYKFERLLEELKACLLPDDTALPVSRDSLMQFVQDFNQLLYVALQERQISARLVFATEESVALLRRAESSVADALNWCSWAVTQFSHHISQENAQKTYIEQTKDYIRQHLSESFTRQDLANHIHVSQNHLARLFRREVGMSIADYITKERMKLAFDLLKNTDLPVGDVALRAGYENYSYFLTLFRRNTGMRPSEYRKQQRHQEEDETWKATP